jgi:hypothetical protein
MGRKRRGEKFLKEKKWAKIDLLKKNWIKKMYLLRWIEHCG